MYYITDNTTILLADDKKERIFTTLKFLPEYKNMEILECNIDYNDYLIENKYTTELQEITETKLIETTPAEYNAKGEIIKEAKYKEKTVKVKRLVPVKNADYDSEVFLKAQKTKLDENLKKAYDAEEKGTVLFKNAIFETSSNNISKLASQLTIIQSGLIDSVQWLSKDDIQIELTDKDIIALGQLISEYHSALWNVQYLSYKEQIEEAKTLEELSAITIEY